MTDSNQKVFHQLPPWLVYPNNDPWWSGWRQGHSEEWLLKTWLPFWQQLNQEEQKTYLIQYPPPNEDWDFYLTQLWK